MHIESEKRQQRSVLRLAYIRSIEEIMLKYKGTEQVVGQFRAERERVNQELAQLQQRLQSSEIAQADFEARSSELQCQLQVLDQQLTNALAEKIVAAVQEISSAHGYDLVFLRKDTVLFSKPGVCNDITDSVIGLLDEQFFHVRRIGRKEISPVDEYWRGWGWRENRDGQERILEGLYCLLNGGHVKGRIEIDLQANTKTFFIWDEANRQWQPQCVTDAPTIEGAILAIEELLSTSR